MSYRNMARLIGAAGLAALGVAAGLALSRTRKAAVKARMVLTGDWEKQLKSEHSVVKKLLKAMVESEIGEDAKRAALLEHVKDALTRHGLEEENVIYPALRQVGAGPLADRLVDDHAEMKTLIRRLEALAPEEAEWADHAKALKQLVYRHAREEEKEAFPLLHDLADDGANETLTKLVRKEGVSLS